MGFWTIIFGIYGAGNAPVVLLPPPRLWVMIDRGNVWLLPAPVRFVGTAAPSAAGGFTSRTWLLTDRGTTWYAVRVKP